MLTLTKSQSTNRKAGRTDKMRKLKLSPLFFVILSLLIILAFFTRIPNVNAVSYYNWVRNSGFETTVNYCENGGMEAGAHEQGVIYGNWSGSATYQTEFAHSGVYSLRVKSGEGDGWYNLTESLLGADIEALTFWIYSDEEYSNTLYIYYSDDSSDSVTYATTDDTWTENSKVDTINDAKYVVAFKFHYQNWQHWVDDVYIGVTDPEAQSEIDFETYPWRCGGNPELDMIGQNTVFGHSGNGSGYIGYDESTASFVQDIDYVDSDTIHFFDLWAYTPYASSVGVKVNIIYSDRTWDVKTVNITQVSTWEHLNYGSTWIDDNKYIIQIQISLSNYINQYVNLDDVGLWSSQPAGTYRFTYSLSPAPTEKSIIAFTCYQRVAHTFYGYLWDENQSLTEDGTYSVVTDYGATSGSIVDGQFNFGLQARSSTTTFTEQIVITMTVSGEVIVINITATWTYTGEAEEEGVYITTPIKNFFVMFLIIFVPPLGLAFEFSARKVNPMLGFIGGLLLMTAIGYMSGLTPLWFLFVCLLITILFMLALFKSFWHGGTPP